jgi:hypothetical protein
LRENRPLRADLLSDIDPLTQRDFPLARPSEVFDPLHRPVRGDLAHIRCAGRIFVPHYAVPMPHHVAGEGVTVLRAAHSDAEVLATLAPGEVFNVLDMAGGWAWGQQGEHGFVGYVPLAALLPV